MRANRHIGLVLLMSAMVCCSCAQSVKGKTDSGTPTATVEASQADAAPVVGHAAPAFSLVNLDGETVSLADFRGKKVLLNFWATWCPPCQAEVPELVSMYAELQQAGYEIIAVDVLEDSETVAGFVQEKGMAFPVLLDTSGQVGRAYQVSGIPTSFFIDEEGIVRVVHVGGLTQDSMRTRMAEVEANKGQ